MARHSHSVKALVRTTGIVILTMPVFACSNATQLESIQAQLADVQLQVLQLQKASPSKDEVAAIGTTVDARVSELLDAHGQIQTELGRLAGEIEQLGAKLADTHFELAQLSQQIAATNQELQAVRNATEAAPPTPPAAPVVTDTAEPQELYDTAYADFQRGNYDLAILGFRQYLELLPTTELADNATYWIGECYYRQRKYQKAASQFDEVITRYQQSDRIPSALLKKGYAYLELGQRAQGIVQLQQVVRDFSGSDEAALARRRLDDLGIDDAG